MQTYRTVLEQRIRERRQTLVEFIEYAEEFAREHNESGTLSVRHLQRLIAGQGSKGKPLGMLRPATARCCWRRYLGKALTNYSRLQCKRRQQTRPRPGSASNL